MNSVETIQLAALATMPRHGTDSVADIDSRLAPILLRAQDLDRIVKLHERLFASAPLGALRHDSPEFFAHILAGNGAILGLECASGELAAYGVLNLPEADEQHYGHVLGLPQDTWPLLAQLEGVGVDPAWHGHGMQKLLGRWRMETAIELGYRHICATAAPRNFYSWRNLIALGLVIRGLHLLYGGFLRYVFHRDTQSKIQYPVDVTVDVTDHALQQQLFESGAVAHGWRGGPRPDALLFALAGGK